MPNLRFGALATYFFDGPLTLPTRHDPCTAREGRAVLVTSLHSPSNSAVNHPES
jgi:hypothetical protein